MFHKYLFSCFLLFKISQKKQKKKIKKIFSKNLFLFHFSFFIFGREQKSFLFTLENRPRKSWKVYSFWENFSFFHFFPAKKWWKVYYFAIFDPFSKIFFLFSFSFFIFHFRRIAKKNFFGFFKKSFFRTFYSPGLFNPPFREKKTKNFFLKRAV